MKDFLGTYSALLESRISAMSFGKQPPSLYEPIRYVMRLGGKRIRPMLTLLSYALFRNDVRSILPYAVAVEVFHNFTLMHDDIMDRAPLRRGKPTVHEKWNLSTAILSGDVMLVKVYELFSTLDPITFRTTVEAFNACATRVCEGQQWDMHFESANNVTEAAYLRMIQDKTAALLGFSLELGAILAGADEIARKRLREFGLHIGTGFQLRDDLLDAYGDPGRFGKQMGGDILANKKTFLLIKALERAGPAEKKALTYWLTATRFNKKKKVEAVVAIYDKLKIPQLTRRKADRYFAKAFNLLEDLPESAARENLRAFAHLLMDRQN
ncbi:MAG: polyprenyl synthetase family protein [Cyclobacteriaceae bacterium]|nr:polyprenyl synthetase family protein [Cyclobacteriaceae bacterium]